MRIRELYPSKYLKAEDLGGHEVQCQIAGLAVEEIGGDKKPVLRIKGKQKGLVLNKTNSEIIADRYGPETDEWTGKSIVVYPDKTTFQGKLVPCLRVRVPSAPADQEEDTDF